MYDAELTDLAHPRGLIILCPERRLPSVRVIFPFRLFILALDFSPCSLKTYVVFRLT